MRRIKDFFYNKNDIIIVLIILAAAAFIIYTRIGVIMDYPEKLAEQNAASIEQTVNTAEASETSSDSNSDKASGTSATTADKPSKTVTIKITGSDTPVTVAQKLADAGLVKSATEFEGYITNMNKTDSIKSGTYKIKKGSSFEKILNTITK